MDLGRGGGGGIKAGESQRHGRKTRVENYHGGEIIAVRVNTHMPSIKYGATTQEMLKA
jgi:hypothetical protein